MSIAQAKALARCYIKSRIPVMLWGPPGVGKSEAGDQLAIEDDASLYETRLSLYESVDIHGLPHIVDSNVVWAMPDMFAALWKLANESPGRKIYWFLDEVNVALPAVMAASMQLVLNRRIGPHCLPDEVEILAAGNRQKDRSSANRMPLAFGARFGHVDVEPDADEVRRYATAQQWDPRVIGFLTWRPNLVHAMPKDDNPRFPSPRSWERVSRGVAGVPDHLRMLWVAGLVGEGASAEFETFFSAATRVPKLEDIIKDPRGHWVPGDADPAMQCATATLISLSATRQNIDPILTYADRLPKDLNVMAAMDMTNRDKTLLQTGAFTAWAGRNRDVAA